jgi:hypothetical protein
VSGAAFSPYWPIACHSARVWAVAAGTVAQVKATDSQDIRIRRRIAALPRSTRYAPNLPCIEPGSNNPPTASPDKSGTVF